MPRLIAPVTSPEDVEILRVASSALVRSASEVVLASWPSERSISLAFCFIAAVTPDETAVSERSASCAPVRIASVVAAERLPSECSASCALERIASVVVVSR